MKRILGRSAASFWLVAAGLLLGMIGCEPRPDPLLLAGGPSGGTYQGFAEALAATVGMLDPELRLEVEASGGSLANLVSVNRRTTDLGLVYAGDAFLGRGGQLDDVRPAAKNVRAVARLYSAAAQLLVPAASRFDSPGDLTGARVAIGNPGSGTAIAAERYFSAFGLWEQIVPIYVGFEMGMKELQSGRVEALWMVVGFPNQSVRRWFDRDRLRLLPLVGAVEKTDFWEDFPFYARVTIPPGTYPGQTAPVASFMDSTLLIAGLQVPEAQIYGLLKTLFSDAGLQQMRAVHPLGGELAVAKALQGVEIPLHAGASHYWKERGLMREND